MKHPDQSKLGRTGFILLRGPYNSSSSKPVRAGTHTGQKPGDRN